MLGFKRTLAVTVLALAAVGFTAVTAFAGGNPGRTPFPVGDLTGAFCGDAIGPIVLHAAIDNEYFKTYTLRDGTTKFQVNGHFVVDVTGNGRTLTFNASGAGAAYLRPDGSVIVVTGHGLVFFIGVHGEGLWLYSGNVVTDAAGLVISRTGHATDICALLS